MRSELTCAAIAGAVMTLQPLDLTAESSGLGSYLFTAVPDGSYTVFAAKTDFVSDSRQVAVSGGEFRLDVDFELAPFDMESSKGV